MLLDTKDLPNPFVAFESRHASCNALRQRRLRASILATTRKVLAGGGAAQFKICRVAEECGVSTQTIHNHFGSRHQLLVEAFNDHTDMMAEFAASSGQDELFFVMVAKGYEQTASCYGEFLRQMMLVVLQGKTPIISEMYRHATKKWIAILKSMYANGVLRENIDPFVLSYQISRLGHSAIYEWATMHNDLAELNRQIFSQNIQLLMGSFTEEAVIKLERQKN